MVRQETASGNGITEGVIWKQLLIFFFPILFGTLFQQLYNTADAIIVGRFVGKEALAAVGGSASVLINLLVNLFVGLSSGATVVVAQAYGAQDYEEVGRTVHTSVMLALTAGAAMTLVGLLCAPAALRAMDTPAETMADSIVYLRVYLLGIVASFLYNIGSAVLRAVGDTRRPLYFLIAACLLNILLDLALVLGLGLGVFGVALATLLSQIFSALLVLVTLLRSDWPLRLNRKELRFTASSLKGILRVGIPAGLQADMYAISNVILQSCINAFGTVTIAAWTAYGKIDGFFWMILSAFDVSITTFVGQNFGAQKYSRIRRSVRVCLVMAFATAILSSVLLCLFSRQLFAIFTADRAVAEAGRHMMLFLTPFYFTYVCVDILSGAIRGTGDSVLPMIMTCGGVCVLRVLWVFFALPLHRTIDMVIVSYPITWTLTSLLFIAYYLQGGWLRRRIARAGFPPEERGKKTE